MSLVNEEAIRLCVPRLIELKNHIDMIGKFTWRVSPSSFDETSTLLAIVPDRTLSNSEVSLLSEKFDLTGAYNELWSLGDFQVVLFLDMNILALLICYNPERQELRDYREFVCELLYPHLS